MAAKRLTFNAVSKIGLRLPGAELSTSYGGPALRVHGRMFACMATNKSAEPGSLVLCIDFDRRDELIEADPDSYYLKDHYVGYPCVLVRLSRAAAGCAARPAAHGLAVRVGEGEEEGAQRRSSATRTVIFSVADGHVFRHRPAVCRYRRIRLEAQAVVPPHIDVCLQQRCRSVVWMETCPSSGHRRRPPPRSPRASPSVRPRGVTQERPFRDARIIPDSAVALTPGTRLGVYEVTAQLGAGGMGEVYRATTPS